MLVLSESADEKSSSLIHPRNSLSGLDEESLSTYTRTAHRRRPRPPLVAVLNWLLRLISQFFWIVLLLGVCVVVIWKGLNNPAGLFYTSPESSSVSAASVSQASCTSQDFSKGAWGPRVWAYEQEPPEKTMNWCDNMFDEYEWKYRPDGCSFRFPGAREKLQWLVDNGGIYLVGDLTVKSHFQALSCELGPHVLGSKTNHLHLNVKLNPESSLVRRLRYPLNFNIRAVPVLSYSPTKLLYSEKEISTILQLEPEVPSTLLNSVDDNGSAADYLSRWKDEQLRFSTLLVSTGSDWTKRTLEAPAEAVGTYIKRILMNWVNGVRQNLRKDQKVIFRSIIPSTDVEIEATIDYGVLPAAQTVSESDSKVVEWDRVGSFNNITRTLIKKQDPKKISYLNVEKLDREQPNGEFHYLDFEMHHGVMDAWNTLLWHTLTDPNWTTK